MASAAPRSTSEYGTSANGPRFSGTSRKRVNCFVIESATSPLDALGINALSTPPQGQTPATGATDCDASMNSAALRS